MYLLLGQDAKNVHGCKDGMKGKRFGKKIVAKQFYTVAKSMYIYLVSRKAE